jgi:SagB-type dehydrogenase family enzyme
VTAARARSRKRRPLAASAALCARLVEQVTLQPHTDGNLLACFSDHSVRLGKLSAGAAQRAQGLCAGLPFASFARDRSNAGREVERLVRQLAGAGLLEFRLGQQVVIEPQMADYWPRLPQLGDGDVLVLSRFAYMRRRGQDLVLESPRAGALFRIGVPTIASTLATLAQPQPVKQLRQNDGFPGVSLLSLLLDCNILLKLDSRRSSGSRREEGDAHLVLWDFHDLLFHARSTEGRHANPIGGLYPYAGDLPPLPAVRPSWPGKKIVLNKFSVADEQAMAPMARLLQQRHSTRMFDDSQPITLAELAHFLEATARAQPTFRSQPQAEGFPPLEYAPRPYPSAGAGYELELYVAVNKCGGLDPGLYHYDAGAHALVAIDTPPDQLETLLAGAEYAMGAQAPPQILITIAARFGRLAWKYSSLAYALVLKDVGALMQTFYLMATEMGLGGSAIGIANIDQFAKIAGIEFHVEGPIGQFALGRPGHPQPASSVGTSIE